MQKFLLTTAALVSLVAVSPAIADAEGSKPSQSQQDYIRFYPGKLDDKQINAIAGYVKASAEKLDVKMEGLELDKVFEVGHAYARVPGLVALMILHFDKPTYEVVDFEKVLRMKLTSFGLKQAVPGQEEENKAVPVQVLEAGMKNDAMPLWEKRAVAQDKQAAQKLFAEMLSKLIKDEMDSASNQDNPEARDKKDFLEAQLKLAEKCSGAANA